MGECRDTIDVLSSRLQLCVDCTGDKFSVQNKLDRAKVCNNDSFYFLLSKFKDLLYLLSFLFLEPTIYFIFSFSFGFSHQRFR